MFGVAPLATQPFAVSESTQAMLSLVATAPNLSLSGSSAQLATKQRIELEAQAPSLPLAGSIAELRTKIRDELAANAPSLALSGSTAQLSTSSGLELLATAPNLALSGSSATLATEDLAVIEGPASSVIPGEQFSIKISGAPQDLSCLAGSLAWDSLDASGNMLITAPHPVTFGSRNTNFNTLIEFTLTQGAQTATFYLVIVPANGTVTGQIAIIDPEGIYADDVGVQVGHYVFARNFTGDAVLDPTTGLVSNTAASSFEYALFDGVQWSDFSDPPETFPDQGLFLSANAPNLSLSGSTAQLYTAAIIELEATAPNLLLSGSTAELKTGRFLTLEASAPVLALSGTTAELFTDAELLLEATAPSLSLSGSAAQLFTGSTLALNATAPNLSLSGSTAQLTTDAELILQATAPNLPLSGSNAWLVEGNLDYVEPRQVIVVSKHQVTIVVDSQ